MFLPPVTNRAVFFRIAAGIVFSVVSVMNTSMAAEKEVGSVRDFRGTANILRERDRIDVKKNEPVYRADTVKTFDRSRVKILFVDDSLLMIGENSSIAVSGYLKGKDAGRSVFNLMDGVLNVIVGRSGFEVRTPTAVTAARGTSYLVWVEGNTTKTAVTEGRVEFSNIEDPANRVVVAAGRMSYVERGRPPAAPVITPPEVVRVLYERTLEESERWGPVILRAKGSGIPPPGITNPAQARLMALRAAKAEALRNLLEQAEGVVIVSDSRVEDFIVKNDALKSRVDAFIKGAWVSEERVLSDGSYEVEMEIGLGLGFRRMLLEQGIRNE